MKIAVVTVHDSANFGSFLQAYALDFFLKREGHEVVFVKTRDKKYVKGLYYSLRPTREWIKHPFLSLKNILLGMKKYKVFKREQRCFKEWGTPNGADMTILGSDEIWNIKTPVFNYPLFYGDGCHNPVAYAVSSGLATFEDFEKKENLCELIKKIPTPLVRDKNTAECVEKITGIKPEIVCDPTLLVEKEIFLKNYEEDNYLENNPYMLVYTYQPEKEVCKLFKDFAKKHGLKLVSVGFHYDWCDKSILCSPLQLCSVMKNARYVITTTFHGTVFSILNHKQFVSVPLSGKTRDILETLGLENAMLGFDELSETTLSEKLLETKHNYEIVDKKIEKLREHSAKLLRKQLEKNDCL